mmetsp:Transcript_4588/g.8776  ORF Transcript_4588/g.8776 Transcript_4588/m.8776 type:complete len:201 (+) Transcript_4588:2364-2966(+)
MSAVPGTTSIPTQWVLEVGETSLKIGALTTGFQTRTKLSRPPETRRLTSAQYASDTTPFSWPRKTSCSSPRARSHVRTVKSNEQVARRGGSTVSQAIKFMTMSVCPSMKYLGSALSKLQAVTTPRVSAVINVWLIHRTQTWLNLVVHCIVKSILLPFVFQKQIVLSSEVVTNRSLSSMYAIDSRGARCPRTTLWHRRFLS